LAIIMTTLKTILPHLFLYEDTCNVYVLRHGERSLFIDCGSGTVVDALTNIGVKSVGWVLFTHHHRDQCFGARKLAECGAQLAVPSHERYLFERATDYWQGKRVADNYNDRSTFFTIGEDLPVALSLEDYEAFSWGPYKFFILPTPGHTLGSITLITEVDGKRVAFTGDLMNAGGKLYQLHAMEYDYGDLAGANLTAQSIHALKNQNVQLALPSHGPVIEDPASCIDILDKRLHPLMELQRDRMGASPGGRFAHEVKMEALTPHLLWGTEATCSNFFVIRSDSGKSLFIDYPYSSAGLFLTALHTPEPFGRLRFIEHHLDELREVWGVKSFDVALPTHIHDDHVCGIPYLQRHYGTACWALDEVAKVIEAPAKWNTPCLLGVPIRVDRQFTDGEKFEWEGFRFEIIFYPGQTEFHAAILGEIDGRRVLFSGDSSYPLRRYLPEKEKEWMVNTVLRNSLTLAMHRKCADEFVRLRPDFLCPGHGPSLPIPPDAYTEIHLYVERKEAIWRDLLPEPTDLGIDLFWARLLPYQLELKPGASAAIDLELRNSFATDVTFDASLSCAVPLITEPEQGELRLRPGEKRTMHFRVTVPANAPSHPYRRHLLTALVSVNGKQHGPIAEALLVVPSA
jgi:glyoxylase-like metal-dependent hydrolase (beta-lactamase superfamily II)